MLEVSCDITATSCGRIRHLGSLHCISMLIISLSSPSAASAAVD